MTSGQEWAFRKVIKAVKCGISYCYSLSFWAKEHHFPSTTEKMFPVWIKGWRNLGRAMWPQEQTLFKLGFTLSLPPYKKRSDFSSAFIRASSWFAILSWKKKKPTLNPVLTFASEETEAQNCIMSCPWSLNFKWQGGTGAQFPDPEAFSPTSNPSLNTSPASSLSCRWMAWWLRAHTWKWMLEVGTQTETRTEVQGHWTTQWPSMTSALLGPGSELTHYSQIQEA